MKLTYLSNSISEGWVFTFGNTVVRLYDDSGSWPLAFDTRESAVVAAQICGLHVTTSGNVHVRAKQFEGASL